MIAGISGYRDTQATSFSGGELPKLEPGGYVLRIMAVKAEETQWGTRLAFRFDIAEGERKDFFKKLFEATPDDWEGKKWKGSYRLKLPKNEGDEARYKKSVGFFKSQLEAFEKSNPGLKIDAEGSWDEQIFKGRIVGAIFNEKEYDFNGKSGFFTQCKRLVPAGDIREGHFTVPNPDRLKRNAAMPAEAPGAYPSPYMYAPRVDKPDSSAEFAEFEVFNDEGVPF